MDSKRHIILNNWLLLIAFPMRPYLIIPKYEKNSWLDITIMYCIVYSASYYYVYSRNSRQLSRCRCSAMKCIVQSIECRIELYFTFYIFPMCSLLNLSSHNSYHIAFSIFSHCNYMTNFWWHIQPKYLFSQLIWIINYPYKN
jgi:hypothetical protein